jgi:putative polyketide hydroxylase
LTLHIVGRDFTLLTLPGEGWGELCVAARDALGVPINLRCADSAGVGSKAEITSAYGFNENGAVLIRPDGHVAARFARECPSTDAFMGILRQVLAA